MKVYIVSEFDGFENTIHGVYSDATKARQYFNEISEKAEEEPEGIEYSIEECEVIECLT